MKDRILEFLGVTKLKKKMKGPMKRIGDQTYYEILEVSPKATTLEIRRAYDRVKKAFHRDSLAVYSLFGEEEIHEIQAAIEEAYIPFARAHLREGSLKAWVIEARGHLVACGTLLILPHIPNPIEPTRRSARLFGM